MMGRLSRHSHNGRSMVKQSYSGYSHVKVGHIGVEACMHPTTITMHTITSELGRQTRGFQ